MLIYIIVGSIREGRVHIKRCPNVFNAQLVERSREIYS